MSVEINVPSNTLGSPGGTIGLYGETPVPQAAAIPAPVGGVVIDLESRAAINSILQALSGIGITA